MQIPVKTIPSAETERYATCAIHARTLEIENIVEFGQIESVNAPVKGVPGEGGCTTIWNFSKNYEENRAFQANYQYTCITSFT